MCIREHPVRLGTGRHPQLWALLTAMAFAACSSVGNLPSLQGARAGSAPSTDASAGSDSPGAAGLQALNRYRAMAHLGPIEDIPALGAGDRNHSLYLVENYGNDIRNNTNLGINFHMEEPGRPGYTYSGFAAGRDSDVVSWTGHETPSDASVAVAGWLVAPFHRFALLNPHLRQAGYGEYCHDGACAAALDISSGTRMVDYRRFMAGGGLSDQDFSTTVFDAPVEFPADGSEIPLREFEGNEWPDPLTSCPGYRAPTGLPISVQVGSWVKTTLSDYSLTADGKPLAVCGIDSGNYTNPDLLTQRDGRDGLRFFGAVILIPRQPLAPGTAYKVSATVNGQRYAWSFTVSAPGAVSE